MRTRSSLSSDNILTRHDYTVFFFISERTLHSNIVNFEFFLFQRKKMSCGRSGIASKGKRRRNIIIKPSFPLCRRQHAGEAKREERRLFVWRNKPVLISFSPLHKCVVLIGGQRNRSFHSWLDGR